MEHSERMRELCLLQMRRLGGLIYSVKRMVLEKLESDFLQIYIAEKRPQGASKEITTTYIAKQTNKQGGSY